MKTDRIVYGVAAMILGAALSVAHAAASAEAVADSAAACIRVRAEARYRALGYNHIVHVADICESAAECDVSTDVNPQPTHVTVPPKSEVEVNTFLGSPARVFTPKVECTMQAR
jgi:hypothetical protein